MNIRRMVTFIVILPVWPFAFVAAAVDDEVTVGDMVMNFKSTWRWVWEK